MIESSGNHQQVHPYHTLINPLLNFQVLHFLLKNMIFNKISRRKQKILR